ncbi:MAG: helix-turn-helix transcriptional regulator [Chloroflexi bacterium]|nr:helix-turn-helix transcriptional regulator [Chloroflexota bacterium]
MDRLQQKVKELREKKGWTQEDLAYKISVSLSTVQRWEKKGGEPTRLARRELRKMFLKNGVEGGYSGREA